LLRWVRKVCNLVGRASLATLRRLERAAIFVRELGRISEY